MSIKDRVAIITGAGRGVGRATALRFAREGAQVVLFSRTPAPLDAVATEISREGYPVLPIIGDVSRDEDVQGLFQQAMHAYGRVDILVNCAVFVSFPTRRSSGPASAPSRRRSPGPASGSPVPRNAGAPP